MTAFLKSIWLPILMVALASAALAYAAHEHTAAAAAQAIYAHDVPPLTARIDSLMRRQPRAETVYVHDTVTLAKWHTTYQHVRDTLLLHTTDTAYVDRFVTVADSTLHACTRALTDCDRVRQLDDSVIQAQRRVIALQDTAIRALRPSIFQRLGVNVGYGAVLHAGKVLGGPIVGATVRIWP